jgi:hypothetical protein
MVHDRFNVVGRNFSLRELVDDGIKPYELEKGHRPMFPLDDTAGNGSAEEKCTAVYFFVKDAEPNRTLLSGRRPCESSS